MFRVILEDTTETIERCDIVSWRKEAIVKPMSFTSNSIGGSSNFNFNTYSSNYSASAISAYVVTLKLDNLDYIYLYIANKEDVDDVVNKLTLAEEEQLTAASISVDDFNTYMAEKMIGNTHDAVQGVKISKIKFNGVFTSKELLSTEPSVSYINAQRGGFSYGI